MCRLDALIDRLAALFAREHAPRGRRSRTAKPAPPQMPRPKKTRLGIVELIELESDLMAGESTASVLAERYDVCVRTIERAKARMRAQGKPVRNVPEEHMPTFHGYDWHKRAAEAA